MSDLICQASRVRSGTWNELSIAGPKMLQILQIPSAYPAAYYKSWDFPLWLIIIALGFISTILFYARSKKTESLQQRSLFVGMSALFFFLALAHISFLGAVWWVATLSYDLVVGFGYIFELIGITFLLYKVEKEIVKQTHFVMTIFSACGVAISILAEFGVAFSVSGEITFMTISRLLSSIISSCDTILIIIIFLYLIRGSVGAVRMQAIITFIGILAMLIGYLLDSELVYGIWATQPIILPPILVLAALLVIMVNQKPH
jgi:hypothetical protein